jgi:predicted RNA-binding Zn-ribbon protein involved in translation (DUF1610 family)
MFSDNYMLLSDTRPAFSYGLPPVEVDPGPKPPTDEDIAHDKRVMRNLEARLLEDPVDEPLRVFLTKHILCASCTLEVAPKDFPLRQGTCGHTICKSCYQTHIRHPGGLWCDHKCPKCGDARSFENKGGQNKVAMLATYYLAEVQVRFEREIQAMHSKWESHVAILERRHPPDDKLASEIKVQRHLVEQRDEAIDNLQAEHEKRVREMREHLMFADTQTSEAESELKRTSMLLEHLEKGKEYYYFICPNCKDHVEKMRRGKITNSLLTIQTGASVRPGLEVDDRAMVGCLTTRSELFQATGFKAMRKHLIEDCVPMEIGVKAYESEIPIFYRKTSTQVKYATNNFSLPIKASKTARKKRRRVSED